MSATFDQEYFDSAYRDYLRQNPARKLLFYRRLLEKHLHRSKSPCVLDLGCAFGLFLEVVDKDFHKFGLDRSSHAINAASKRIPEARFVVGDCAAAPFAARFDAVVAFDVLEHISALEQVAQFVRRSLKPAGVFIFVVPVYDGPFGKVVRLLDRDSTHIHTCSRDWWLEWAGRHFEVVTWLGIFRYLFSPIAYIHVPGFATRYFAPAIAVVARLVPAEAGG